LITLSKILIEFQPIDPMLGGSGWKNRLRETSELLGVKEQTGALDVRLGQVSEVLRIFFNHTFKWKRKYWRFQLHFDGKFFFLATLNRITEKTFNTSFCKRWNWFALFRWWIKPLSNPEMPDILLFLNNAYSAKTLVMLNGTTRVHNFPFNVCITVSQPMLPGPK
jgi:hypothetical protein